MSLGIGCFFLFCWSSSCSSRSRSRLFPRQPCGGDADAEDAQLAPSPFSQFLGSSPARSANHDGRRLPSIRAWEVTRASNRGPEGIRTLGAGCLPHPELCPESRGSYPRPVFDTHRFLLLSKIRNSFWPHYANQAWSAHPNRPASSSRSRQRKVSRQVSTLSCKVSPSL